MGQRYYFLLLSTALNQLSAVDTTSLVALIAMAGLAVGLALKNSLQNFAAGVMLIVFKPFKIGDFVDIAGEEGIIETVGVFSTTMKSLDNKSIIVPNGGIYQGTITSYSAKETRRVDMVFGIGYDDDIKPAKEILTKLVKEDDRVLPEPKAVIARSDSSL